MKALVLLSMLAIMSAGCLSGAPADRVQGHASSTDAASQDPGAGAPKNSPPPAVLYRNGSWVYMERTPSSPEYVMVSYGKFHEYFPVHANVSIVNIRVEWSSPAPANLTVRCWDSDAPNSTYEGAASAGRARPQGSANLTIQLAQSDPGDWLFEVYSWGPSVDLDWNATITLTNGTFPSNATSG